MCFYSTAMGSQPAPLVFVFFVHKTACFSLQMGAFGTLGEWGLIMHTPSVPPGISQTGPRLGWGCAAVRSQDGPDRGHLSSLLAHLAVCTPVVPSADSEL